MATDSTLQNRDGGWSWRFGQAHQTSVERSAECCMLRWNNIFYWWAH